MVREYETLRSLAAKQKVYATPNYVDLRPQPRHREGHLEDAQDSAYHAPNGSLQVIMRAGNAAAQCRLPKEERSRGPPTNADNSPELRLATPHEFQSRCLELLNSPVFEKALTSNTREFREYVDCSDKEEDLLLALEYPEIFRSVCICDPKLSGAPIKLKSKHFAPGPRGIQVGNCHFLNIPHSDDKEHCAVTVRSDSSGTARYVLEYTCALFSQESGKPVYLMSSQMDISKIVYKLTNTAISRSLSSTMATTMTPSLSRKVPRKNLASLAKCRENASTEEAATKGNDMDWVAIATESHDSLQKGNRSSDALHLVQDKSSFLDLNELFQDLKFFHKSCFTLSPAADIGYYQLTWLSAHLNTRRGDLAIGFERNSPTELQELGRLLSKSDPVSTFVHWGIKNKRMRMYCIPMFDGQELGCWLCFFIDACIPSFWT